MIRTLEANSRNSKISFVFPIQSSSRVHLDSLTNHVDSPVRQRPLSQPCTRMETNAILTNTHRQFGTTTDDAKLLSKPNVSPSLSSCLNTSHRSDISLRSITK